MPASGSETSQVQSNLIGRSGGAPASSSTRSPACNLVTWPLTRLDATARSAQLVGVATSSNASLDETPRSSAVLVTCSALALNVCATSGSHIAYAVCVKYLCSERALSRINLWYWVVAARKTP